MTADHLRCVDAALDAERAGDFAAALEWHRAVPQFRRGRHGLLMENLVHLGEDLPDWVWARVLVYLTTRCEDGRTGRLTKEVADAVIKTWHADQLADCYDDGGDPIKVAARVLGESWIYQQLATFENGGLGSFIEEHATGRLAEHAALACRWADAPMSGYRLRSDRPGMPLHVDDLGTSTTFEVLDLGADRVSPGGWVIGRLVPSGVGDLLMFDTVPLPVTELVARVVAGDSDCASTWHERLLALVDAGLVPSEVFFREDYELTCDVPELELLRFGTPPADHARVLLQLHSGSDEVRRAAYRVLCRARRGELDRTDHAFVAAAVANVRAYADLRRDVMRSGGPGHLAEWAGWIAEPSRSRLRELLAG